MVSVSVCYLFYQPMDEKNKTRALHVSAKEKPNMEKALFDWPIVLQYDVKAISRKFFGHEVFSAERSLNQPKARCVCIRSINRSNRFISVRLFFCFVRAFSFQSHTKIALTLYYDLTDSSYTRSDLCVFCTYSATSAFSEKPQWHHGRTHNWETVWNKFP